MPRANWKDRGLCNDGPYDDVLYEPDSGLPMSRRQLREARRFCRNCPVRRDCLAFALIQSDDWGVWGGYTPAERKRSMELAVINLTKRSRKRLRPSHLEQVAEVISIFDSGTLTEQVIKVG